VRVGEHLLGVQPQKLSIKEGMELISHGALNAIVTLWDAIVHAVIGWLALGPIAIAVTYPVLKWLLSRVRLPARRPSPPAVEKQA